MEQITGLLVQHGLLLVFANVLLAQSGVPVPAVPTLIVAGAFVIQGRIALGPLILVSVAASLIGDTLWYLAGRLHGYRVLRTLCRVAIEPDSCVKQTETIFERWGAPSLILAKYIPGFATIAPRWPARCGSACGHSWLTAQQPPCCGRGCRLQWAPSFTRRSSAPCYGSKAWAAVRWR